MSVREKLIQDAIHNAGPLFSLENTERWVDQLLAEHAHELAEKIRANATEWQENYKHHWFEGQQDAADLIDPEPDRE